MKKNIFSVFLFCLICMQGYSQSKDTLIVATYTYATNNRIANIQPFASFLSQQTGLQTKVASYPTVRTFVEAIQAGQVDVAFINTFGYLWLATYPQQTHTPVAALNVKKGTSNNYKSILITHSQSGITSLAELQKRAPEISMMFVNEGSTSGNLVPRMWLSSVGIHSPEKSFKQVVYGNTHANTLTQIVEGKADAGAFGSEEYFKLVAADPSAKDKIRILWLSDEIPLGPVLLNKKLPKTQQKQITKILLSIAETNPDALTSIKNGWSEARQSERFISVNDAYYNTFRNLTGNDAELRQILGLYAK